MINQSINCVLVDRNPVPDELSQLAIARSIQIRSFQIDVSVLSNLENLFKQTEDIEIKILFNNAGYLLTNVRSCVFHVAI
jgi:short-subunit dehydrogenase